MIKIEFSIAIALYIGTLVSLVVIQWLFMRVKTARSVDTDALWQCPICTYVYFDYYPKGEFSTCPRCDSFTKKEEMPS
ncbi:hypothetical protein ACFL1E_02410 [Candidatus Omnitrophota bacterium]